MKCVVTGGGGFIGSHLVNSLEDDGQEVIVIDDFRTGKTKFLESFRGRIENFDILTSEGKLENLFHQVNSVYHLSANADVRFGWNHPRKDFEQNMVVTLKLLEACRNADVSEFIFSSTGSVYGNQVYFPTPESADTSNQTSLYSASKIGAEAFISSYAEAGWLKASVFRFVSILGPRYTHGHVYDFASQLLKNPTTLKVLGNGFQSKSYLHVFDCIEGIRNVKSEKSFDIFNLGTDETCTVRESVSWITQRLGIDPLVEYGISNGGWVGDNPIIYLDTKKAKLAGWNPRFTIRQSVETTVDWLLENRNWVF